MASNAVNNGGWRVGPWRMLGWGAAGAILLTPLIAMQFTHEVNWTWFDFAFAGVMLLGVGLTLEFAASKTTSPSYRAGVGVALLATLLIVWFTGAVGIIGDEHNDANFFYFGPIAIALFGSAIARFRAGGMALAMVAAAVAHIAVSAVALVSGWGAGDQSYPWDIVGSTCLFAVLWLTSAWLFRRAAH